MFRSFVEIITVILCGCFIVISKPADRLKINKDCVPPLGISCTEIKKCPFFADLLARTAIPRPRNVIRIIRDHHCGFLGDSPKVCCFPVPNITRKIETKEITNMPNITTHRNMGLLPMDICGSMSNEFRIIGGTKTVPFEFPWMALIIYNTSEGLDYKCGGTIINERYILTAAHCTQNLTIAGVRLGEHNVATILDCNTVRHSCAPPVEDFYIEDIITHPDYIDKSYRNDIALLRLAKPANFSHVHIKPICLPIGNTAKLNLDKKFAIVTGWGVTENGFKSAELLKTSLPVIPNQDCKQMYENHSPISSSQICAGGFLGRDSCGGDSGGPLKYVGIINTTTRYIQYGIVSYGPRHCGIDGQPGVYTRVTHYIDWILDNLSPD